LLKRLTVVYDLTLDEAPPDDEERPIFATPDTFFAVVLTSERDDDVRVVHQVLDYLYRGDGDLARHVLAAARAGLESELEELAYRWRAGRMADLGYVD